MHLGVTCHPPGADDDLERVRTTLVRVVIEPSSSDDDIRHVRDSFAVRPLLTPFALLAGGQIEKAPGVRWELEELVSHGVRWWRIWKERPVPVTPWTSSGNEPDISAWASDPRGWGDVCLALYSALRAEGFVGPICGGVSANMDQRGIDFAHGMDWSRMPADMPAELHCYPRITSDRTIPHIGRDLDEQWEACHAAVNLHDVVIGEFGFNTSLERHLGGLVTTQLTDDQAAQSLTSEASHYLKHGCLAACVFVWNDQTDHDAPCFGLRRADRTWKPQAHAISAWADTHLGSAPTRQLGVTVLGPEAEAISVAFSPGDQLPVVLGEREPGTRHVVFKDLPGWLSDGHLVGAARIRAVGAGHIAFDEALSVAYNSLPLAYELPPITLTLEPILVVLDVRGPSPETVVATLALKDGSVVGGDLEPGTSHFRWLLPGKAVGQAELTVKANGYVSHVSMVNLPTGTTELPAVMLQPVQQPQGDVLAWSSDFLLRLRIGHETVFPGFYLAHGPEMRAELIRAQTERQYQDILLDIIYGGDVSATTPPFDFWENHGHVEAGMKELVAAGQRPIIPVGFEDLKEAEQKYGGIDKFSEPGGVLHRALSAWGKYATCMFIGVEADEWASWDEIRMLVQRLGSYGPWPIVQHFKTGVWGPAGQEMNHWRQCLSLAKNRLAFTPQYEHPHTPDGGFLSGDNDVTVRTRQLLDPSRLGGLGIPIIAGEYDYLNDEYKGRRLGGLALSAGAIGYFNGGTPPDEIDPKKVTWLHRNVSQWPITSALTAVRIEPTRVCLEHTMAGHWPQSNGGSAPLGEGNPWVFVNINGSWFGGTYEWLRPGQICKGVTRDDIGAHVKKPPLETWKPESGELVGFMVSCRARDSTAAGEERSNVRLVRWP